MPVASLHKLLGLRVEEHGSFGAGGSRAGCAPGDGSGRPELRSRHPHLACTFEDLRPWSGGATRRRLRT